MKRVVRIRTLTIMVNDPIVADAGLDTVVLQRSVLQLEGYYPTIGVLWSGTNAISSNALMDSQAGLINPQLLPPGDYTYLLETGSERVTLSILSQLLLTSSVLELSGNVFCVNDGIVPLTDFTPQGGTWEGQALVMLYLARSMRAPELAFMMIYSIGILINELFRYCPIRL